MSQEIKDAFEEARRGVELALVEGVAPGDVVAEHTRAADGVLAEVFTRALEACGGEPDGVALVALGGYGRCELTPASDLDLLLLHRGWSAKHVEDLNRGFVYPLWDAGRDLGDRVREPREVVQSLNEVEEAAAMLDARLLAGDAGLFRDLLASVLQRLERGRSAFFSELVQTTAERHHRFGHAGHLLEPNIRDSAGGLRDVHTLLWASKLLPGAEGLDGLVASGLISEHDRRLVVDAHDFLLRVRLHLHVITGRHQDQLYLAEQDEIAGRLGSLDDPDRAPADALMQVLYAHARDIEAVTRSFWERTLQPRRRFRRRSTTARAVGHGCVVQDGRIEVVAVTHPADDPVGWLRVFLQAIRHGVRVGRASLARLHHDVAGAGELTWSSEARSVFLEILQSGQEGVGALETMDAAGFLPALIPEWEGIRCLPQRDLYHRFTVDRHLFEVVAELAASRSSEEIDVHDAWSRIDEAEGLFVAALLHDVGKGRGGDHSDIGAGLATGAAERMGLGTSRVDDVAFCVREHLTLAGLATHRDLSDPQTTSEALSAVGDARRLAMLFLLTRADSLATGPEAWSSFRSALVRELYAKTLGVLEGESIATPVASRDLAALGIADEDVDRLIAPMPAAWTVGLDIDSARRQLTLLGDTLGPAEVRTSVAELDDAVEFLLVAHDRPGLFATVSGVLNLRGIEIHDADIYTRTDGIAVEIFRVRGAHGVVPDERWARVHADIERALAGELDLDHALAQKARQSRTRKHARVRTGRVHVVVDAAASSASTVIEVHVSDRPGLLREITQVLKAQGCDLTFAKVATYGAEVVDVFYVCDLDGKKIVDPGRLEAIERALRRRLGDVRGEDASG